MSRSAAEHRWWPWSRRRPAVARDSTSADASELVSESEAFLLGRYVELLEERGEPVPVWAWTNVLAHGSRDDVDRAAAGAHGWSSSRRWRIARALVAGEVLETVGRGAPLSDLQREVLAPLELELVRRRGVWTWTPERWLATVRSALRSYRHSNRI